MAPFFGHGQYTDTHFLGDPENYTLELYSAVDAQALNELKFRLFLAYEEGGSDFVQERLDELLEGTCRADDRCVTVCQLLESLVHGSTEEADKYDDYIEVYEDEIEETVEEYEEEDADDATYGPAVDVTVKKDEKAWYDKPCRDFTQDDWKSWAQYLRSRAVSAEPQDIVGYRGDCPVEAKLGALNDSKHAARVSACVEACLRDDSGAVITNFSYLDRWNLWGLNLFHLAARYSDSSYPEQPVMRALLSTVRSCQPSVSQVDSYWIGNHTDQSRYCFQTPLHFAIAKGNLEAIKLLCDAGFNTDTLFLDLAAFDPGYGWKDSALEDYMANFDNHGNTLTIAEHVHAFCKQCRKQLRLSEAVIAEPPLTQLLRLASEEADGDHAGAASWPRPWTSCERVLMAVTCLLEAGADVNKMALDGQTPLSFASKSGNTAVVEKLLEAGANTELLLSGVASDSVQRLLGSQRRGGELLQPGELRTYLDGAETTMSEIRTTCEAEYHNLLNSGPRYGRQI
ncbi:hypothetical protein CYMTET_7802 [Cymbomonas tetramitiformis]|uniref:Uncharacterized protein n=1 Tax=Cymbomonas tetramitiformis TaxID=36881 RepID=A0AAE0GUT0_9CHLO|nr:hypothetical protein CYMTET_7802 [Cymbomonas tetramitiformis]|eukprot:gene10875-12871_t